MFIHISTFLRNTFDLDANWKYSFAEEIVHICKKYIPAYLSLNVPPRKSSLAMAMIARRKMEWYLFRDPKSLAVYHLETIIWLYAL